MKHQTPTLPKFKKLKRRLGLTRDRDVMGLLESLWLLTQKSAPRGDVGKQLDNEDIAIELEWDGDADELVNALVDTRWLDRCSEHRLVVHDWATHAPRYVHGIVSKRGGFAVQQNTETAPSEDVVPHPPCDTDAETKTVATTVPQYSRGLQSRTNSTTVADCTREQPNLTKPNLTKPNSFCSEADKQPSEPEFDPAGCRFPEFPCCADTKTDRPSIWKAAPDLLAEWQATYPGISVNSEHRKAHAWIMSNLTKRKTQRGMLKFLNGWFARAQDRSARASPSQATLKPEVRKLERHKIERSA
jgi:hypothetical protein